MQTSESCAQIADSLAERFHRLFGTTPKILRAPGRVNLIGEHTDYNYGFVMPAAIGFYTWVAAGTRNDRTLCVRSEQFDETVELSLDEDELDGAPRKHWGDFIRGVAAVAQAMGHKLSGANLLIHGDVPIGAGLSSSASLEVATAMALLAVSGSKFSSPELVKMCQRAEHEYVGTRCGIMDQFVAVFGRAEHAIFLDCRSLSYEAVPIPADVRLVICNSMVKHEHAAGEYNRRRADCEAGVRILQKRMSNVHALRDVTMADLEAHREALPELVYRRCRHVINENERVLAAAKAFLCGDLNRIGQLMYESHRSLRDDYEVSCPELDLLVEIASGAEGVHGTRMTGGGFGGCTVALLRSDAVEGFQSTISERYKQRTGIVPAVYICSAAEGARAWPE